MSRQPQPATDLAQALRRFVEAAEKIWEAYQAKGPGNVGGKLLLPAQVAAEQIRKNFDPIDPHDVANQPGDHGTVPLAESVGVVFRLAQQCTLRPEGLCFVTGEAGLVPRRDLHDKLENTLHHLRRILSELEDGTPPP